MQLIKNKILFFLSFVLIFSILISNNISAEEFPSVDNCKVIPGLGEYWDPNGCDCSPARDVADRNNIIRQDGPPCNNTIIWSNDYCLYSSYTPCISSEIPPIVIPNPIPPYDESKWIGPYKECELNGNAQPGNTEDICRDLSIAPDDVQRNFCLGNKWNECDGPGFCEDKMACFNFNSGSTAKCLSGKYYREKKRCHYCINIAGTGSKKVTIFVLNPPAEGSSVEIAEGIVNGIISTQPFKYLHEQNKFTFQVVVGKYNDFIPTIERDADGHYDYNNFESKMIDYMTSVCSTDYGIVVDYSDIWWSFKIKGYYRPRTNFIFSSKYSEAINHELGHSMCHLADEYFTMGVYSFRGINLDTPGCSTFDSYRIDKQNCYEIQMIDENGNYRILGDVRKSTSISMMVGLSIYSYPFNIISCAGCLNTLGGMGVQQGVNMCKNWSCQGTPDNSPVIRQSQQECP